MSVAVLVLTTHASVLNVETRTCSTNYNYTAGCLIPPHLVFGPEALASFIKSAQYTTCTSTRVAVADATGLIDASQCVVRFSLCTRCTSLT